MHSRSQAFTRDHMVELTIATLNTPPQVDGLLQQLSGPDSISNGVSGPSWRSDTAAEYAVEDTSGRTPRPLHRRLSPEQRTALAAAFASGIRQKDLAAEYGISIRSVKRLVHVAREAGQIKCR